MPPAPLGSAILLGLTTLAGVIALSLESEPFHSGSALAVALGLAVLGITATSGVLLARGRWARWLTLTIATGWFVAVIAGSLSWADVVAAALAVTTAAVAAGPWLCRWLRRHSATDGPPPAAVVLLLSLMSTPALLGFLLADTGPDVGGWLLVGWSWVLALLVARMNPAALVAGRLAHLPIVVACLAGAPVAALVGLTAKAAGELGLLWRRDVGLAVRPLAPSPSVAIPPELVDPSILDAAGLDYRGRRRNPANGEPE